MSALFSQAISGAGAGASVPPSAQVPSDTSTDAVETTDIIDPADSPDNEPEPEGEPEVEGTETETVIEGEGEPEPEELAADEGITQVADAASKTGAFKPEQKALDAQIASLMKRFPGVGKEHENAIKKMAHQELFIAHLQAGAKPEAAAVDLGDGLTEYERRIGLGKQDAPQQTVERVAPKQAPLENASAPSIYDQAFGRDYGSLEDELAAERVLSEKFTKGEASYSDIRTLQAQRIRRQFYTDPMTRAVFNKMMAEELESAGISPQALRELSANTFQTQDWNFAVSQQAGVKGFEDLVTLSEVTSPKLIRLPDGRQVPDSQLNRLMLDNWDQVSDINVSGANERQTSIRTNLSRLRILHKIHRQQKANATMASAAVQTGVDAGKNAGPAAAKARLNGGGKTATPSTTKTGFGGQTEEPYSAKFTKNRETKFSSL